MAEGDVERYRREAERADKLAANAHDLDVRDSWKVLAQSYRKLAKQAERSAMAERLLWTVTLGDQAVALVSAWGPEAAVQLAAQLSAIQGRGGGDPAWDWRHLQARPPSAEETALWRERAGGIAGEVAMAGLILEPPGD